METLAVLSGIAVAFIVGRLLFGLFFEDASDFMECLRFSLRPGLFA